MNLKYLNDKRVDDQIMWRCENTERVLAHIYIYIRETFYTELRACKR